MRIDTDFYSGKKVLITGHTGFKGTWMSKLLVMSGADVTGYALKNGNHPNLFEIADVENEINSVYGDIRDYDKLRSVFEHVKPDIVIHMAAQPLVREAYENPRYTYDVNVMGTVNVLECIRNCTSVKSFVNVTTDKVYENKEWEWGYRENERLNGFDPYSNSKSCSELVTDSYKNSFFADREIAISTLRAGNVIGGGDFAANRIIPDCIRAVEQKKKIIVRNPYSTRPYQHVLEPVAVYLMLAQRQYEDKSIAGAYNVGPDEQDCLTTGELVNLFCTEWGRQTGQKVEWEIKSDGGPHEAGLLKLDCSKLKHVFSWKPRWNIEETMQKIVEWYYINSRNPQNIVACMKQQIIDFTRE